MANTYDSVITAADLGNGGLLPVEYAKEVIEGATKNSVMLSRARRINMSTRTRTQPVLDSLPMAYWVGGDTGLKQTTKAKWAGLTITAEEIAAIVPIPEAVIADANIDLWAEIRPRLAAAIGVLFDKACLFGTDKPSSFPEGIVPMATTAGNVVAQGTGADLGVDVATLAEKMATEGFSVDGFASQPGLSWQLRALRDTTGQPIYHRDLTENGESSLYGFALDEVDNGAWDNTAAVMLAADWSNFVVGVRQDITYKLLDQSVITDDDGKVVLNLAQQDCVALRCVFRGGFQIANPITQLETDSAKRFPAGVITPKVAVSSTKSAKA